MAILFTMLSTLLLIPVAGLALDGAIVYLMKAKLSAAVDAAALATARGLSVGTSLAAQTANATQTGNSYFAANLPAGTMGATIVGGAPTISVSVSANNTLIATVQASIQLPLYFLRLLRFPTASLSATGEASRRVSNVIFVLDRSYSLAQSGSCGPLISAAQSFVNMFVDGRDMLGLVTFQATSNVDYPPTTKFKSSSSTLTAKIGQLQCTGYTNMSEALYLAYQQIIGINQPLANNVIFLFTDGKPDSFTANFQNPKTQSDTRYDESNTGTLTTMPATSTTCANSIYNRNSKGVKQGINGVLLDIMGDLYATGYTGGIYQDTQEPINWVSPYQTSGIPFPAAVVSAPGCNFTSSSIGYPNNTLYVRDDIASLPSQDLYTNPLTGHWPLDYYSSGPYSGQARIDTPQSVMYAAMNATDNMAKTIRNDSTYNTTIYTVGLGSGINTELLERIANDPRSSSYDSSQATGVFIYATPSSLASAFQQVASQILRLSK